VSNQPTTWGTPSQPLPKDSRWLLPFLPEFRASGLRVLDAGCGPGLDAATLVRHGFEVVGFDRGSLKAAGTNAQGAGLFRANLQDPLPLRTGSFDAALASLSLHYLPWDETRAALGEIRRVLRPGAPFLFRVNATDDVLHAAGEGELIERGFYRTPNPHYSDTKRFFDEAMMRDAVAGLFEIVRLRHMTIARYADPKRVWECLALAQ